MLDISELLRMTSAYPSTVGEGQETVKTMELMTITNSDGRLCLSVSSQGTSVTLFHPDGRRAIIDWSGPTVTYAGEMAVTGAAQQLFDALLVLMHLLYTGNP